MKKQINIERLKKARENQGITMAEAARRLNLSKIGYCRYEYGERSPSLQTIEAIARCFNTSVAYLTGDTNDITPDYLLIDKENDPELFSLIQTLTQKDETSKKLIEYYKKIKKDL